MERKIQNNIVKIKNVNSRKVFILICSRFCETSSWKSKQTNSVDSFKFNKKNFQVCKLFELMYDCACCSNDFVRMCKHRLFHQLERALHSRSLSLSVYVCGKCIYLLFVSYIHRNSEYACDDIHIQEWCEFRFSANCLNFDDKIIWTYILWWIWKIKKQQKCIILILPPLIFIFFFFFSCSFEIVWPNNRFGATEWYNESCSTRSHISFR